MKNLVDWNKAPEGATHYNAECTCPWLKETPPSYFDHWDWIEYTSDGSYCEDHFNNAVKRPQMENKGMKSEEWTGKGLPSVGMVCEYLDLSNRSTGWVKVKVVFIGGNLIVLKHGANGNEFSEQAGDVSFRPIKTPEQIAEEERLSAIHKMIALVGRYSTYADVMGVLYDAGYRKT